MSVNPIADAQERWSALTPAERTSAGPEAIEGCAAAVTELGVRLRALDYPAPITTPCDDVDAAVEELAEGGVPVPPPLRLLWEVVGEVSLVDLGRYRHVAFWDRRVPSDRACDGIVIEGPSDEGWIDYQLESFEQQTDAGDPPGLVISPDALHKDDVSGGDPYELVPSPDDPWLPTLRWFDWTGPTPPSMAPPGPPDVVSYLRIGLLACGGFPGLYGIPAFEPIRLALVADLPLF